MSTVFTVADAEARKTQANEIAEKISKDISSIVSTGIIEQIAKEVKSTEQNAREASALVFKALAEKVKASAVPFLLPLLPAIIELCGEKKSGEVRTAAAEGAKAFAKIVSEHGVDVILPIVLKRAEETKQWQESVLCLELLTIFAETAPDQVSRAMVMIVPAVSALMWSTKKQVKDAALVAMKQSCRSIENIDLEPFIPSLIEAITQPEKVEQCVHALAGTTFVTTVTASALSVIVPVLDRGFKEKKVATIRKTAVIVENMARLVADPKEVAPFMPFLEPALAKQAEQVADPECRSRCLAAHAALLGISAAADKDAIKKDDTDAAEHAEAVKQIVRRSLRKAGAAEKQVDLPAFGPVITYATQIAVGLGKIAEWAPSDWNNELGAVLLSFGKEIADGAKENIRAECQRLVEESGGEVEEDQNDDAEQLCDARFSLAYGSKILLNTARLHLKRGRRYGIIAAKSAGKTTLLRSISNGQINGFPTAADGLKCVFVEHDIQASQAKLNVVEWILETVGVAGITSEEVKKALLGVLFTPDMLVMPITSLSGGWKMKLAMARAMLQKADILLLDEPTNHLDVLNVQWVVDYLVGPACTNVTSLIVSHDTHFLDKVATNIIHFSNSLKLDSYVGNLSAFVERHPEAKAYFELGNTQLVFKFPSPGPLEGVKNKGKAVMTMQNVQFTYPGAASPQLYDVNIRVALASRVACVGANGAGKSTMIKLLTGELKPSHGVVTRHPNLRFAYVAQHAFHHIEQHLDKTPNEYIRWRFTDGSDKEEERKTTSLITPEERAIMEIPFEVSYEDADGKKIKEKRVIEQLMGRRKEGKTLVYEIKFKNKTQDQNRYMEREELIERGFKKMVEELDRKKLAQEGAYVRTLTQLNVQEHLEAVGLDAELGSHNRIRSLSGGQKVKVVLGAATWPQPHIIILDEPTNYLDREALGALGNAIIAFDGGVVLITHNQTFAEYTTRETWVVANNRCDIQGDANWQAYEKEAVELGLDQPENFDASGNTVSVETKRTPDSVKPRDKKKMTKDIKQKIIDGDEMTPFEEECCTAWGLWN